MFCRSLDAEKSRLSGETARLRRALKELRESKREIEELFKRERRKRKKWKKAYDQERQKREELEKRLIEIERQRDRYRDMIFKPNRQKNDQKELEVDQGGEGKGEGELNIEIMGSRKGRGKRRGGQKGHRGYGRRRPERIDEEIRIYLEKCPICENPLARSKRIKSHTVEDIPAMEESQAKITRYHTEQQWCPHCKKMVRGRAITVIPRSRLGINILLYVMHHKYLCREPWETIVFNLYNWYGVKVSKGNLVDMMHRGREWMGAKYNDLLESIRGANVKYADETGWRVEGKNHWLWGFFTDRHAYYTIEESRGKGVAQKILKGSHPQDVLVRDDYGGYMKLPLQHQSCWAHLLRESHERACRSNASSEIRTLHQKLKTMFSALQKIILQPFQSEERKIAYSLFKLDIQHIIDTNYLHDDAKEIQTRIRNQSSNLITALLHDNVPLTNNHSERNIRNFVVVRKISGGSRSDDGAKTQSVLMSVMRSILLQNLSLLPTLKKYLLDAVIPKTE